MLGLAAIGDRTRDLILLGTWSLLELFWYRPLTALWRTWRPRS
jgi:hypothetical protein